MEPHSSPSSTSSTAGFHLPSSGSTALPSLSIFSRGRTSSRADDFNNQSNGSLPLQSSSCINFQGQCLPSPLAAPPIAPSESQPLAPNEGLFLAVSFGLLYSWFYLICITHLPSSSLHQVRDPMTEVGIRANALARLGMVSGTWGIVSLVDGTDAETRR